MAESPAIVLYDSCYFCGTPVKTCGALCPNCTRQRHPAPPRIVRGKVADPNGR